MAATRDDDERLLRAMALRERGFTLEAARWRSGFRASAAALHYAIERVKYDYLASCQGPIKRKPMKKREVAPRAPRLCAVPGCNVEISRANKTGVCRGHNHFFGYCGCVQCARYV